MKRNTKKKRGSEVSFTIQLTNTMLQKLLKVKLIFGSRWRSSSSCYANINTRPIAHKLS